MRLIRKVLYVLILSALFFVPLESIEIANLEPIQAVWLCVENEKVVLTTDTKDVGIGSTVADALKDMKYNSPGIIYLDTAQYLLVSTSDEQLIAEMKTYVKDEIFLCKWNGEGKLQDAVKYADAHNIGIKFRKWRGIGNLPELPPIKQEKYGNIPS